KYDVSGIKYDKNGNIKTLIRKGHINIDADVFGTMDNLVYSYDSGNKLHAVTDTVNNTYGFKDGNASDNIYNNGNDDYTYDVNGNMISDANKGITNITYNHLNLPKQVTIDGKYINYVYDATGVKLSKYIDLGYSENEYTYYAGNYIYKRRASRGAQPKLEFFNHPEGYVSPLDANDLSKGFKYIYQYKDHLGNVRLSYTDNDNNGVIDASSEIVEESNYYPFGLKHKGYNGNVSSLGNSSAQKFGFGGKELNQELGIEWMDFGARNYDASLGRWMNLDPLAEDMRRHSPYNYAFDNPVYWIDPDGMKPEDDYFNKKGEYLGSDNAETDNVQIVSQKDWDANKTVDKNGKGSISKEKGAEISTNFTENKMSWEAVESVVKHYDNQLDDSSKVKDVGILSKIVRDDDGKIDNGVLMRSESDGEKTIFGGLFGSNNNIQINLGSDGKVSKLLNTASNIKNTLVHEYAHQKGIKSEKGAVKVQKAHPDYCATTEKYRKNTDQYEKDNE
ncbi:RHS repeat-associated core domain-containing protein, partial [Tenacibaculum finnmarkense]|uniref:RHS repeat-associated core domain-containing protein n=1 Tax=Tenacibaculum finnmarkense TaxID=2781243 RepID=UPI00293F1A93